LLLCAGSAWAQDLRVIDGPEGSRLTVRVCPAPGGGEQPLALLNHGAQPRAEIRPLLEPPACDAEPVRWFTSHGYTVAAVLRRGHGPSTGDWAEGFGPCEDPDFLRVGRETARDIQAALTALLGSPGIRATGAVVLGESAGGWGSIALASQRPAGVAAVINVAGGRGGWAGGRARTNCAASRLIENVAEFGATARVPMLWLYAGTDTYFGPSLAGALFDAFVAAGGVAEMTMLPPWEQDGHYFFYGEGGSLVWGPRVADFLDSLTPRSTAQRR
jgi:pimeloyl-ACP methyl ester carboxylesterase